MKPFLPILCLGLLLPAASAVAGFTTPLASPAPADSGESNLRSGPDGTAYLTYAGPGLRPGERAVWLATLAPGATAWSEPRCVVSTPHLMENWADFASLAVAADGGLTAQWFQFRRDGDRDAYTGWFARSKDAGATWSKPAPLGQEFVSLAALSGGRTLAVWLESTGETAKPAGAGTPPEPAMRLKSHLLGPGGEVLQEWVVDPDVCTCCQTSLAVLPGDRAILTYRGHTAGEIRDHRVSLFTNVGWTPPRSLQDDGWKIPACPVNGPAAGTNGEHTAIAWFTAANGVARVQARQSLDGGITFGPAIPLDLGRPIGRLALVMLPDNSAVISWLEAGNGQNAAGLYVRRLFPDGALSAPQLVAPTSALRASGFARLAARPGASLPVVISWTQPEPTPAAGNPRTRVGTAEFSAAALVPGTAASAAKAGPAPIAVVRAGTLELLEVCTAPVPGR